MAEITGTPQVNMIFAKLPRKLHAKAFAAGAYYYCMDDVESGDQDQPVMARYVCDWSISEDQIDRYLEIVTG